jgi:hypothetical protein
MTLRFTKDQLRELWYAISDLRDVKSDEQAELREGLRDRLADAYEQADDGPAEAEAA